MALFARISNPKLRRTYLIEVPTNDPQEAHEKINSMFAEHGEQWAHLVYEGIVEGDPHHGVCPGCGKDHNEEGEDDEADDNGLPIVYYAGAFAMALMLFVILNRAHHRGKQ